MRFSKALFAISAVAVTTLTIMLLGNTARADVESPAPYRYYRTTQSFKISMMGSSQKVPVPSGVVVRAQKETFNYKLPAKTQYQIDFTPMSYKLRKQFFPKKFKGNWTSSTFSSIGKYLQPVSIPKSVFMTTLDSVPFEGYYTKYIGQKRGHVNRTIVATTDGYIESYSDEFDFKPKTYVKIRKIKQSGDTKYYYYRVHMKGLRDKHIRKHGTQRYRLKIVNNKEIREVQGNDSPAYYSVIRVGGVKYYGIVHNDYPN
jgi:hypothetical protein